MPSYARRHQLQNSLIYHAFNRSNAGRQIFNTDDDYQQFINLLKEYIEKFSLKTYHWVIMPNHYHLLFEIEEPDSIPKFMAGFNRAYTHYYHRLYSTFGFLWQGRFKLQAVQKERYLLACGRYIERNPVKANIVLAASDYAYSSARFYCLGIIDGITVEGPTFREFGADIPQRQLVYKEFLRNFDTEEERGFSDLEYPQGDKEFVRRLVMRNGRYMPRKDGRPVKRVLS